MPEVIRCPECNRTMRYARPSLKRFARDAEGKAILNDGEPVMEMAYMCRGGHIFYHIQGAKADMPRASKQLLKEVLEELDRKKKVEENA